MQQSPANQLSQHTNPCPYHPPTTQAYQYKILITECNSYVGSQLVETFRNDDEIQVNPNILCGTVDKNVKTIGQIAVDSVIDSEDKNGLNSVLKDSDIVIFQLNKNNSRLFQYFIKLLARMKHEGEKPKRVICVSSLLTWNGRRGNLDFKANLDNLPNRNSSQTYLMQLQNLCLNLNNIGNNIESFVVCSGLIYGFGQDQLFRYFKQALQQSQSLKIYGTGSNVIPMIHLEDLCNIVRDIAFTGIVGGVKRDRISLPRSRYYFAIDSSKTTQHDLIKCIANNLGNGKIQQIPVQNCFLEQNYDQFTINSIVDDLPTLQNWHTIGGLVANIQKIVSQFNLYRGLKPNKIFIMGPPAAGKSKLAQVLEKAYGLPVLTVKKVLDELQTQENEFATQIKIKLQQIRTVKVEEQRKIFEEAKKKKKGKKDAADEFDPSKIIPRLPEDQLIRVFKRRLGKSDCMNKGYILDGWPKTAKSCQALFTNEKKQVQQATLPNAVFNILATQEQVKERIKGLPQNVKEGTHWTEQGTVRRFQAHAKSNEQGLPKNFFNGKVDIKDVSFNYEGTEQFIQFIERNGPLGFKKKEKPEQTEGVGQKKQENDQGKQKESQNKQEGDEQQNNENNEQEQQNAQFDLQKLTEHQKQILNEKSRPIRQYLIDNVIPQITEGLLQICKETPRDPIGFLIKFLQNKEIMKHKSRKM